MREEEETMAELEEKVPDAAQPKKEQRPVITRRALSPLRTSRYPESYPTSSRYPKQLPLPVPALFLSMETYWRPNQRSNSS